MYLNKVRNLLARTSTDKTNAVFLGWGELTLRAQNVKLEEANPGGGVAAQQSSHTCEAVAEQRQVLEMSQPT